MVLGETDLKKRRAVIKKLMDVCEARKLNIGVLISSESKRAIQLQCLNGYRFGTSVFFRLPLEGNLEEVN